MALQPGEGKNIQFADGGDLGPKQLRDITYGTEILHVIGYIAYRDKRGTTRRTGFLRYYDRESRRFRVVDDPSTNIRLSARLPVGRQILVDEGDRHAAFADRGGNALDRARPHVAAREDAGDARFEQVRIAIVRPAPGFHRIVSGQDIAARIARDLGWQPIGLRVGSDEDEKAAAVMPAHRPCSRVPDVDRGQVGVAVDRLTLPSAAGPRCSISRATARSGSATCSSPGSRPGR